MSCTLIIFFVNVPVLSVNKKLTFARSSSADNLLTMIFFVARAITPNSIIRVITVGRLIGMPAIIRLRFKERISKKGVFSNRETMVSMTTAVRLKTVRNVEMLKISCSSKLFFLPVSTENTVFPK